jgi:hypothetical protein
MSKTHLNQAVLRDEREMRGLTKSQMADVLGLDGINAEQILTDFESGFRQPRGATLRLYESLNGQRWGGEGLLGLSTWTLSLGGDVLHHNAWPRFVGRALREKLHPNQWQFKKANMATFELDERTGFGQVVFSLIDHVPSDLDVEDLFTEGVRLLESRLIAGGV